MEGVTDLQGNPRILNKVVDIGCYEVLVTGLMMIVRGARYVPRVKDKDKR